MIRATTFLISLLCTSIVVCAQSSTNDGEITINGWTQPVISSSSSSSSKESPISSNSGARVPGNDNTNNEEEENRIVGFPPVTTQAGHKITFKWDTDITTEDSGISNGSNNKNSNINNVYLHQDVNCDPTGSILLGDTSPTSYVWTESDANRSWLITSHSGDDTSTTACEMGQFVIVTVNAAPQPRWTIQNWMPPNDGEGFAPLDIVVGETIRWEWSSPMSTTRQTVYAQKGQNVNCFMDEDSDIEFVGPADLETNPRNPMKAAWYTFTEEDGLPTGKRMWFTSGSEEDCFRGTIIQVTVYSTYSDLTNSNTNNSATLPSNSLEGGASGGGRRPDGRPPLDNNDNDNNLDGGPDSDEPIDNNPFPDAVTGTVPTTGDDVEEEPLLDDSGSTRLETLPQLVMGMILALAMSYFF